MPTFLSTLQGGAAGAFVLRNERTGGLVATTLLLALERRARRTGLLDHHSLAPGHAMVIAPSFAVHTFHMRFPIDVAFVARDGRILKIRRAMPAGRVAGAWRGFAVVEMAAGAFAGTGTVPGDVLRLEAAGSAG